MAFQTTYEQGPDFLKVVLTGDQTVESVYQLLATVSSEAARLNIKNIMVDYRQVRLGELSTRERVAIGMKMAATLGKELKVAIVYDAPRVNRFAEVTASIEGAAIRTVATEEEAIRWLRSGGSGPLS